MKSYATLSNELEILLKEKETKEKELINVLEPIRTIIKIHKNTLGSFFPTNVEAVPVRRIKERLSWLKEDVLMYDISEEERKNIIVMIEIAYNNIILLDKEETDRKITSLLISLNQRKNLVEYIYEELKDINKKIKSISQTENNQEELEKLNKQKELIISDKDMYEDIKILFDYDDEEDLIFIKKLSIKTPEDIYNLVNKLIKEQINEVLKYRYLKRKKVEEITNRLKESIKGYVDRYILTNNDLSQNIEEFEIVLNAILKEELEDSLEIKNELGVEYVSSNENNKTKIITVKEVVEKKCNNLQNHTINKYATILELSQVDEKNLDIVRNFVINMGPEFVQLFDNLWIQEDVKNRTKILELKKKQAKIQREIQISVDYS